MKRLIKVLKTRDRLIEVAHRLFLLKGVENTTMSDIADASDKGRRTLYTYFKSKGEIFNAVIKREGDAYLHAIEEIKDSQDCSINKLDGYIKKRFEILETLENHHNSFLDWLRNGFRSNAKRDILTIIRERDSIILNNIVTEGIRNGEFDAETGRMLVDVLPSLIQSAYINPGKDKETSKVNISGFILNVIKAKPYNQ